MLRLTKTMVYNHKIKAQAIKLRLSGRSYGEILKALNISSKGTLSVWFRGLRLSSGARKRLRKNIETAYKRGLFDFNKQRTQKIFAENKKILTESAKAIPELSQRDLLLIGAALYWCEGTTREKRLNHRISFSNSDPRMISIFMKYLRETLEISEEKIYAEIHAYPNIDIPKAKQFWLEITRIMPDKLSIYFNVSKVSKFVRPKDFLPYGTLNIRVNNRQLFYRIKGYIQGIINQLD